ncbi:MAG TPA: sterol desaturase family protein [Candidatus Binatia bacterium]|nr:sterol desaturase family protein [Candidatus Binatia bacterium]
MAESDAGLLRLIGFGLAIGAALVLQRLSPHSRTAGSLRVNGELWVINIIVMGTLCGACVCSAAQWAASREMGLLQWSAAPTPVALVVSVLFLDLVSYAWHRANHVVPFLWRWHRVHHSDPSFTVSTSLRFHPGELILSLPLRILAVVVLGAPVLAVVVFEVVFTLANSIEHGDINLPRRFEAAAQRVFVTPALHRWHHTVLVPDRDTNFGTIFSVWDRLFGSFSPSDSATTIRTGVPGVTEVGLRDALAMPFH